MTDTTQNSNAQAIAQTVEQVAVAVAPAVLAATTKSNPQVAAIATLAPIAISLLQNATQLQQAGSMSQQQLANLFESISQGIVATHAQWESLTKTAS